MTLNKIQPKQRSQQLAISKIQPRMGDNNPPGSATDGQNELVEATDNDVVVVAPPPKKKARKNDYRGVLVRFINYIDNTQYEKEDVLHNGGITKDRLNTITPSDVMRWMNKETFGTDDPGENFGEMTPLVRCWTIEMWKKAISHYIPNRLFPWDSLRASGNPTRSKEVNDLIKYVKKKEARREGADSKARRSIKKEEFALVIKLPKRDRTKPDMEVWHSSIDEFPISHDCTD